MRIPRVVTELPGPKSKPLLEAKDRLLPGPYRDGSEIPLVMTRKSDWIIEDLDGNTWADHVTGWGSTPLGASYEPVIESSIDALRRYGLGIRGYLPKQPMRRL